MRSLLPIAAEGVDLEASYAVAADVPWHVRVSFISSADGAVTVDGRAGGLGSAGDRRVFALLRDLSDVIVVGAGTARAEGYAAPRPTGRRLDRRRRHGLPDAPTLALVSERLAFDPEGGLFPDDEPRTVVITSGASPPERRAEVARHADVLVCGAAAVDLVAAAAALRDRGLSRVHCEGGPQLFATALRARVVDELCLTLAPLLTGPGADRIVAGVGLPAPAQMVLDHVLEEDGYLFLRYQLLQAPPVS
ncbi:MAG: dihydrofolate reductase family protein [Actinomycetota bacterium]|nr:dihydrofolate reductase family protein [Actinomycetota bacterium]